MRRGLERRGERRPLRMRVRGLMGMRVAVRMLVGVSIRLSVRRKSLLRALEQEGRRLLHRLRARGARPLPLVRERRRWAVAAAEVKALHEAELLEVVSSLLLVTPSGLRRTGVGLKGADGARAAIGSGVGVGRGRVRVVGGRGTDDRAGVTEAGRRADRGGIGGAGWARRVAG